MKDLGTERKEEAEFLRFAGEMKNLHKMADSIQGRKLRKKVKTIAIAEGFEQV